MAGLQRRIDELTTENASLKSESKGRRIKLREATTELESLRGRVASLTSEVDGLKTRAEANPASADDRVQALEAQIKARDVKDAFAGVKLAPGIKVDQVFKFFDVDPNGLDLATLKVDDLAKGWREAAPGLFESTTETVEAAPGGAKGQSLDLGHLVGRGGRDTGLKSVTYTRAEVAQAGWQQKRPELVEALKAGTAQLAEG